MLLLECNDLSFSYHTHTGEISVIKSVSFRIHKGEFVSIVGPSGCGKSTLLGLLTGILSPEEGSIKIHYKQKGTQSFYGYMRSRITCLNGMISGIMSVLGQRSIIVWTMHARNICTPCLHVISLIPLPIKNHPSYPAVCANVQR